MPKLIDSALFRLCVLLFFAGASSLIHAESTSPNQEIYSGYYSREQNDGDMARSSRKSHYIRFYPGNRVVRLIIPFPYSTTLNADTLRKIFKVVIGKTSGSAYLSDTFGLLDQKIVAHLDSVRLIDGTYYYDCGMAVPCRIEFAVKGMNIIQKGLIKDQVTAYDLVPD
ncbi:hypothetical protein ACFL17_01090 [Pseudomonadota bacterium]